MLFLIIRNIIIKSFIFFRNNSIACLRAKAQEHQARLLNSGLLLQVRSLAGLQNHSSNSPQSFDSNANNLGHHTPPDDHHVSIPIKGSGVVNDRTSYHQPNVVKTEQHNSTQNMAF